MLLALFSTALSAEVTTSVEKDTGLRGWTWQESGVSLQLVQRLPDQTRAFFQGRGFSTEDADTIGRACVFQTIFRNDGKQLLDYDVDQWQVVQGGKSRSVVTREQWDILWKQRGATQAARIAMRWSLLPTQQQFKPGDYNWGMSSYGLPPGAHFDLSVEVMLDGQRVSATINDIECAVDRAL
ncbi:hypothetical protein [Candidatus Reidiella endopervernicosa]|uniref:Uncharacterized protein n=1 Tax=Candidatus Reidiella endopervernicosa TaxID=2738883 RepID=A0A6N0HS73_9GAMM|nr:hypothetical protein [Candidatus Reidiella endopervernicosa]QKQ25178.1 hypothetical protein HUE57_01895 [Candidatus Reidiella endopervernicosa]